jgi:hypothetical protein
VIISSPVGEWQTTTFHVKLPFFLLVTVTSDPTRAAIFSFTAFLLNVSPLLWLMLPSVVALAFSHSGHEHHQKLHYYSAQPLRFLQCP